MHQVGFHYDDQDAQSAKQKVVTILIILYQHLLSGVVAEPVRIMRDHICTLSAGTYLLTGSTMPCPSEPRP
jgi:hypothetical protein